MTAIALAWAVVGAAATIITVWQGSFVLVRWLRRRDPLRLELAPHRLGDRLMVTIKNRGDEELSYGWCSLTGVDQAGKLVHAIYPRHGVTDIRHKDAVGPDGLTIPIERSNMPPLAGVQWIRVDIRDMVNHHASIPISADLALALKANVD